MTSESSGRRDSILRHAASCSRAGFLFIIWPCSGIHSSQYEFHVALQFQNIWPLSASAAPSHRNSHSRGGSRIARLSCCEHGRPKFVLALPTLAFLPALAVLVRIGH